MTKEARNSYLDWSPEKIKSFRQDLLDWYDKEGRDLPWRRTKDPYMIWVSEIMLQQTQVATVIPYYERFIEALPDVKALAQAEEDVLLNLWQGLGYYSRVRNMQAAAKTIVEDYKGEFPRNMKDLLSLKGIGPYTAAAIASIAFNQAEPAIDGNLLRITARLFEIKEDIGQTKNHKIFHEILSHLIDPQRPGDFNQALMDLGSQIMTPTNYQPDDSPIKDYDLSYQHGTSHLYPVKAKKIKQTRHEFLAFYLHDQEGHCLMHLDKDRTLLAGLWNFPLIQGKYNLADLSQGEWLDLFLYFFNLVTPWASEHKKLVQYLDQELTEFLKSGPVSFPAIKHVFSHRIWQIQVIPFEMPSSLMQDLLSQGLREKDDYLWASPEEINQLPLSSLQLKMFEALGLTEN